MNCLKYLEYLRSKREQDVQLERWREMNVGVHRGAFFGVYSVVVGLTDEYANELPSGRLQEVR